MYTQLFLIIACLITGFLLGRIGSRTYDGTIVFEPNMESFKLDFTMSVSDVARCRSILLKVEEEA